MQLDHQLRWLFCVFFGFVTYLQAQLTEDLRAQGLLGSHFGVPGTPEIFDYIIVGGGTAGLTLARRLAANASSSVAVIEAGSLAELDNGNHSQIPSDAGYGIGSSPASINPLIDWMVYTTPQSGLNGKIQAYAQGKVLGGGSVRNSMWFHRGTAGSYQQWADAVDDQSYSFPNFLPYFQRSVNFTPPSGRPQNASVLYNQSNFSPLGGPLHVSYASWVNAISSWLAIAFSAFGLREVPSFMDGNLLGWSYIANSIEPTTQTRSSSETSFLREALLQTTNLIVYKSTLAKSIAFDRSKSASGVNVETAGLQYQLVANKEVIVSAGVFRSPQLLMVSGIGPAATLQANSIECIADRPGVGQNMWDHVLFGPTYNVDVLTAGRLSNPQFAAEQLQLYKANRTGLLTSGGADLVAFDHLPDELLSSDTQNNLHTDFAADWPTVEMISIGAYAGTFADELADSPVDGKNYAGILAALVAPFSRGNVTISSNDTTINPVVNPNWLADARDQEVAVASYKYARQIYTSSTMKPVLLGSEVYPGTNVSTDLQILNEIKRVALQVYHAAGTNRMGLRNDTEAVVDSNAKVIGVNGLRVVDASAFPLLPPGHPQSTVCEFCNPPKRMERA
ncbi:MAG: hypothetical protein Q9162_006425 [Coniocarpon cinnabarinum]